MKTSEWMDRLIGSIGDYMHLETTDGVWREGKITGFTFRKMMMNNVEVSMPIEIEINGDPADRVPLERISILRIG